MVEIVRDAFSVNFPSDFSKAAAVAETYLSDKTTAPKWGDKWTAIIKNAGYVIGRTSATGCCWWHVDYDATKKLHINAINAHTGINNAIPLRVPGGLTQSAEYLQSFLTGWWFDMTTAYQNASLPPTIVHNLSAASKGSGLDADEAKRRLAFFRNP